MMKFTVQVQTSIEMPEILSLYAIFNLDNKSYVQNRNRVQSKIEASTDILFFGLPFQFRGCPFTKESNNSFSGLW